MSHRFFIKLQDFSVRLQGCFFVLDVFYEHAPAVEQADLQIFIVEYYGEM